MAKRKYQRRARARRFGQLMLLAAALLNTPVCLAELDSNTADASKVAAPEQSSRELLLYLGEFDPELDPVELSQMSDTLEDELESNTDAKTAAEVRADAANEPKK